MMFNRLADYFTPELQSMVNEPTTPVSAVLALPYICQSARVGFPRLIEYFASNAAELIRIAFSEEDDKLSKTAYTILLSGDPKIIDPILSNYLLTNTATELLTNADSNSIMIGRLSSLTQAFLYNLNNENKGSFGYIFRLLPHCGNPSVFNLFCTICGDDPKFETTQQMLDEMGFSDFVFREFDNMDVNYKSQAEIVWKDPVFVRFLCLYQLITKCCTNPILQKRFRTPQLVELLSKEFVDAPDYLKSAKWEAINAATCPEIAVQLLNLIDNALQLLSENFEHLRAFRVSALSFITNMMRIAPLTYDLMLKSVMPQMLINLVVSFPNSTLLHAVFITFVETGLANEQFALRIVNIYTPVIVDCVEENQNKILLPTCMKMLVLFTQLGKKNKEINQSLNECPGYDKIMKTTLKDYLKILNSPYGEDTTTAFFKKVKTIFT